MPQISGINIAESISITFFTLTLFNLLVLIFFYEIVAYGMATVIRWLRIISILYGITVIVLGILAIVLEDKDMDSITAKVWAALSTNEKDYFNNEIKKLQD